MTADPKTPQKPGDPTKSPPGYKNTEVGVIPEDWEVVQLSNLVVSGPQNGYSTRSGKDAQGTLTLSLAATSSGNLILDAQTVKRLYEVIDPRSDLFLRAGDVLVQRANTLDLVGTTVVFDGPPKEYVYPDLMMRLRFEDSSTAHWFWRYANSEEGRKYFASIAAGSTGSMPKISGERLRKMPIPLPPLHEQRAIAAALSDVDALISALDALISKKRAVKTAAMQQLLTGKRRLPGFSGEWQTRRLGSLLTIRHGRSQHDVVEEDGKYPILATGGEIGRSNTFLYDKPSVLIGRKGTIDKPQYQDSPFWTVDTLFYSELKDEAHPKFVYYKFLTIDWRSHNEASGVPSLNSATIENIEIKLPSVEEQTAIAEVLSDMDAEISALEARREKTRKVKRGVMQELLTGRTRLV